MRPLKSRRSRLLATLMLLGRLSVYTVILTVLNARIVRTEGEKTVEDCW